MILNEFVGKKKSWVGTVQRHFPLQRVGSGRESNYLSCVSIFISTAPYFTAVDLANLAKELDEDERVRMAEGGVDSPQYLR